jgi:MoaA/NifB/PqqE/SkfB family radical SAM enzyme
MGIQFSLDGLEDTHALYRIGTDYNKIIENAKAFIKGGGFGQRRTIIFKHNEHQLDEIKKQSLEIGFCKLAVIPCDDFRYYEYDKWPAWKDGKITHYLEQPTNANFSKYEYNHMPEFSFNFHINESMNCPNFREGHIYVTYKGHIIPCCAYQADLYFDHPKNDQFREVFGDYSVTNLNNHKLSHILSQDDTFFDRLESNFKSDSVLSRCVGCHKYNPNK